MGRQKWDTKMLTALVAAGAFGNEFFELVEHVLHPGIYKTNNNDATRQFPIKTLVDTLSVISAGTVATLHTVHNKKEGDKPNDVIAAAFMDSMIPIVLAFAAPTLVMQPLLETVDKERKKLRLAVGLVFIAFLASMENVLASAGKQTKPFVILGVLVSLGCMAAIKYWIPPPAAQHSVPSWRNIVYSLVLVLFFSALAWGYNLIPAHGKSSPHLILAGISGAIVGYFAVNKAWKTVRKTR